jgi:hypothetical protein
MEAKNELFLAFTLEGFVSLSFSLSLQKWYIWFQAKKKNNQRKSQKIK